MAPKPRVAAKPLATKGRAAAEQAEKPLFLPRAEESSDSELEGEARPRQAPPKQSTNVAPPSTRAAAELSSGSDHSEDEDLAYDSDEDPVVREYDIFMTSELARNLYLFQYPVRSRQKPYTKAQNSCPIDARLKPKAGLVEVDIPVNVGVNFDQEKGRVWGDVLRKAQQAKESGFAGKTIGGSGSRGGKRRKVKGGDDDEEGEDDIMLVDFQEAVNKGRVLNTQTLGSKMQPDEARYMVGVFRNGMLLCVAGGGGGVVVGVD
jgi:DNA-directed RNA polymerase-3 subunit RPC5